jgi:hypothetical protein
VREQGLPEGRHESTRQYVIATRASEGASVTGGMLREHEAILNHKRACENASISREMLQENKAIPIARQKGRARA